ncbi:uncharacterized protein DUF4353 [Breznakia blatticola]|uniref:Uncharacterized protein DUF4353 n=1 Tax=Breznakia blatticola TaxID=1754012 RepID=A0A4R8A7H6_9FIRM|nr:carbohydrate-binding domain-containing protein [Breznakia blatticola]TDW26439.1 uncharacterized protein DUF4353 [Breznakia blatticola]
MKYIKHILPILLVLVLVSACQTNTNEEESDTSTSGSTITLKNDSITSDDTSVQISETTATITKAGTYTISGTLDDGQILVDANDTAKVTIILDNVDIHCETSSAIYIKNADETTITLKENTENTLSDGSTYTVLDESEEPDATLFSKDDLVIDGNGSLTIQANYKDGIGGKDDVNIKDATISIQATDDGIRGKDSLIIENATLTITAVNDALKATNDTEADKGILEIHDGSYTLTTTGTDATSHKAIKAYTSITISDGTFDIDATDDAVHSQNVTIDGGTYTIATGDDGIHADATLLIHDGTIDIKQSYEGLEAADLQIHGGNIQIVASDDGINAAGGSDSTTETSTPGFNGGPGGNDMFSTSTGTLQISGGIITVDAQGDGIDVNGDATITGGTITVYGPANDGNGALDYDGSFAISGGQLIAYGTSGMALNVSENSSLTTVMINLDTTIAAGANVSIVDDEGNEIYNGTNAKNANSFIIASSKLAINSTYTLQVDGSKRTTFTPTSTVTTIGNSGGMNGGPGGGFGGPGQGR